MTQGSRTTVGTADSYFPPGTGYRAEAGTALPSGRASEASTVVTYTNTVVCALGLIFIFLSVKFILQQLK